MSTGGVHDNASTYNLVTTLLEFIIMAVFSDHDLSLSFREYLSSCYELNQSSNMSFSCRKIMHVFFLSLRNYYLISF